MASVTRVGYPHGRPPEGYTSRQSFAHRPGSGRFVTVREMADRVCPCGNRLAPSGRGRPRQYCSSRCHQRFSHSASDPRRGYVRPSLTASCGWCGSPIARDPRQPTRRFCSAICQRRAKEWELRGRMFPCSTCGTEVRTTDTRRVFCSALCFNRAKNRRLWAAGSRRKFPTVRGRRRIQIAERDGWRCGLCHAVIDPDLRYPHPGSLSLDHIDPNGAHEPANWQASHLACNVQAGAKGAQAA